MAQPLPLFVDRRDPDLLSEEAQRQVEAQFEDRARENRDARERITAVYRQSWEEFYNVEQEGCRAKIRELATLSPQWDDDDDDDDDGLWSAAPESVDVDTEDMMDDGAAEDAIAYVDFDTGRQGVLACSSPISMESFDAHPKYEACTPTSRNIDARRAWPPPGPYMDFIPYAGEPGFDEARYVREIPRPFAWQRPYNNDVDLIAIEALQRLVDSDGFTSETVDQHNILPPIKSSAEQSGLLQRIRQRDIWRYSMFTEQETNMRAFVGLQPASDLMHRINEDVDVFCPSRSCLTALCMAHNEPNHPLLRKDPQVTNTDLKASVTESCGPQCFSSMQNDEIDALLQSGLSASPVVEDVIRLFPDALPCLLAPICKASCIEIYAHRCRMISDENVFVTADEPADHPLPETFLDDTTDYKAFSALDYCSHYGPCGPQCPCFMAQQHCQRSCRCSWSCKLRNKGCRCKGNKCVPAKCRCIQLDRECDPELCGPRLKKKGDKPGSQHVPKPAHTCSNLKLQENKHAKLEVKIGSFGLGTFAINTIREGALIGEYAAELFWTDDDAVQHLEYLARHRNLNYIFELDRDTTLDAASAGNDTRYINHTDERGENVFAKVIWINGEHRIIFVAKKKIKAGKELFLNYGDQYWNKPPEDV